MSRSTHATGTHIHTMPFKLFSRGKPKTKAHQLSTLQWQDVEVQVSRKVMKSIRLKLTNTGELKLSCPHFVSDIELLQFLNERQHWITTQQQKLALQQEQKQRAESPGHLLLWGEQQPLTALTSKSSEFLSAQEQTNLRQEVLRAELKNYIAQQVPFWQTKMGVEANFWNVRAMKTKWGSCNVHKKRVWLNVQLAAHPKICAQMVLVHELVHLLEPSHNKRFYHLMDTYLPNWREADEILKSQSL